MAWQLLLLTILSLTLAETVMTGFSMYLGSWPELIVYEHGKGTGRYLRMSGPEGDFNKYSFNDIVSNVHAVRGDWELYEHSWYSGQRMIVREGWNTRAYQNDFYSSARPICKYYDSPTTSKIQVFEHGSNQGAMKEFHNEVTNLHSQGFGDKISSVRALKGDWELYDHINYEGGRELIREGESRNVRHDTYSSLRPLCETYKLPKCKPVRIEVLGSGNRRRDKSKILGPSLDFSCSDGATSTISLSFSTSVTESVSIGFSKSQSKGIDWSLAASVSVTTSVGIEVPPISAGGEITATVSASVGGSSTTTVEHSNTKEQSSTFQSGSEKTISYNTPGGAIVFGTMQRYKEERNNVAANVHLQCLDGSTEVERTTISLEAITYDTAEFEDFTKTTTVEKCNRHGYYTRTKRCINNVKQKYENKFGELDDLRREFYACF